MIQVTGDSQAGFSLIELVVGIAILSVAVVPVAGFFANNTRLVSEAEKRKQALQLARWVIEDMKGTAAKIDETGQDFTDSLDQAAADWNQKSPSDMKEDLNWTNEYKVDVTPDDYQGEEDLKQVTVVVSWNLSQEKVPQVELNTLIARR